MRPWSEKGQLGDPFLAPTQIASDLERLILQPEQLANLSKVAKDYQKNLGNHPKNMLSHLQPEKLLTLYLQ